MSTETVRFPSYSDECEQIKKAIQVEFSETPVGDIEIRITGKDRAHVVIPLDDPKSNILPTELRVPIRLDTDIRIAWIIQLAREFYDAAIAPFSTFAQSSWKPSNRL